MLEKQAVEALSPALPGLQSVVESGEGQSSARLPEFQYQLEVRQTGKWQPGNKETVIVQCL